MVLIRWKLATLFFAVLGTYILLMLLCLDVEIVTIEPPELAPSPAEVSALLREAEGICQDETAGKEKGEGGQKTRPEA